MFFRASILGGLALVAGWIVYTFHIAEAFALNPLLFLLIPVALFAAPSLMRGETPAFMGKPWFGWTCVVVLTGFWIGRNVI
jgi:hypothetical protein